MLGVETTRGDVQCGRETVRCQMADRCVEGKINEESK